MEIVGIEGDTPVGEIFATSGQYPNPGRNAMSPEPSNHYEEFARDCVRLAQQADTPELRRKLLDLAREWMRASRDETTIPGVRLAS
jgi:hypothetical protein